MQERDILFLNAAIQNRSYDLDSTPGKVTGIFATQLLNKLAGNQDVVHAWNNVGLFAESEADSPYERLKCKYQSSTLGQHIDYWGISESVEILTDDDKDFGVWAGRLLEEALDMGYIYTSSSSFHYCEGCDLTIAEKAADIHGCSRCGSDNLSIKRELGLFVDMPDDRRTLLPLDRLFNVVNVEQAIDSFKQLPPRLLLSRTRSNGISLDVLGLPNRVIDPRLGIGLLAIYVASIKGYDKSCMVQSQSTLVRTVPYLRGVIHDAEALQVPEPYIATHTKIQQELLTSTITSSLDTNVLMPLASLRRRNAVSSGELESLRIEQQKYVARSRVVGDLVTKLGVKDTSHETVDAETEIDCVISNGRLNDLLPMANRTLGRSIQDMKQAIGGSLDAEAVTSAQLAQAIIGRLSHVFI